MAFVFYRHPRRPNEVSATIVGSEWAITAAVERLEREGNEVTRIVPPPTDLILQRVGCRTQIKANRCG
jgi:hypothetical protein